MFKIFTFISAILISTNSYAEENNTKIAYDLISRIYIKMHIDEDNKIPKQDRNKWEERLSDYINFESLNNGMRESVRKALNEKNENLKNQENIDHLAEKAVAFYLPKLLVGYTYLFLKVQDQLGELPRCENNPKPTDKKNGIICISKKGNNILYAYIISPDKPEDRLNFYIFEKTDRWRLTGLNTPIDDGAINMIGVWK